MPKNDFSKLSFKKAENLKFKDKRELLTGKLKGDFTRDGLRKVLQKLSDKLEGKKHAQVSVSFHYKKSNDWTPSYLTNAGEPVKLYDPLDSPKGVLYEDDTIDGVVFFIVKGTEPITKQVIMKPKQEGEEIKSLFRKKKT